ncbi:MAG TPA: DUF2490 domain-containing protein [Pyrinomonadaceae bacterium]
MSETPAQALPPVPEEDTQFWNDLQVAVPVTKRVDFNLYGTFRFGRDASILVDRRVGAGFAYRLGRLLKRPDDFLSLSAWYLNIITRPGERRRQHENRLNLAATLRFPVGKVGLSDRNLFERRVRFPLDSTRYRNRFQIDYPARLKDGQFGVFASDEVFYDWSVDDWVRNRFAAGVSRRFNKHFTGDLYYMRQNDGRSRPGDLHVIGLTYRVRL